MIDKCPTCGSTAGMVATRYITHDDSTGESVDQSWLTCVDCGKRTTQEDMK